MLMHEFIDCNCMIGMRGEIREGSVYKLSQFKEIFDRCGIKKAIVHHAVAVYGDFEAGNRMLADEIGNDEMLTGQWIAVPNAAGDCCGPVKLIREMAKNGIKTVRILPKSFGFSVTKYACGELMDHLRQHRIPLFVDKSEIEWKDLYTLCTSFTGLRVVICGVAYSEDRQLWPIMDKCADLYLETSAYVPHNGICDAVQRWGAERLLFGSGLPYGSACGAVTLIRYADIGDAQKEAIAGKNIQRLLADVR